MSSLLPIDATASAAATSAATIGAATSTAATSTAPKKKERVVGPTVPCPPAVATAWLILRVAVADVLGLAPACQDCTVSLLQPLWRKPGMAGQAKFSVGLGKKGGRGVVDLQCVDQVFVLEAVQAAANRLIAEQIDIDCWETTPEDLLEIVNATAASTASSATTSKNKNTVAVTLAVLHEHGAAVPPALPYANTNALAAIEILNMARVSVVQTGQRKAELTLMFAVTEQQDATEEKVAAVCVVNGPGPPSSSSTSATTAVRHTPKQCAAWNATKLRAPEGAALLQTAQAHQAAQKEAAAAATTLSAETTTAAAAADDADEMVVTIEDVKGKIDYTKLVEQFGSTLIDDALQQRLYDQTVGQGRVPALHRFLRRGMFFSHRDLDTLLGATEKKTPMYLYTGRGPSSDSMHLGHLIPFLFTKWLQDAFDAPLVIQMTDDEKFIFKGEYEDGAGDNLNHFYNLTMENARDIIACGFDYKKTFIFSDLEYVGQMYPNIVRIWKAVTTNTVTGIFGFDGSSNIGKVAFPAVQAAPSFASSFPKVLEADRDSPRCCLIPCAIDQDPYFRMTRDVAHKLVSKKHVLSGKPSLIHSKFFPPLQGATGKMSSSDANSAIFLTDSPEDIERKIKKHAFSGGQATTEEQRERGADLEVDVSYQWLRFFLEDDDELERIGKEYGSGQGEYWSTGKVKERLIAVLQDLVAAHKERRAKITDEEVRRWMTERSIVT